MKFFLIIFIFLLLSCEAFQQAPPATFGSGIPINNYNPPPVQEEPVTEEETDKKEIPDTTDFGDVRCHPSQYKDFNVQVRNFLSTSFNPQQANYTIKCYPVKQWNGGFFIKGNVSFSGKKFDTQSSQQNLTPAPGSYLEIHIVDISNRPVTQQGKPIRMSINTFNSFIQGQNPSLVFEDQRGKVTLNGNVNKNRHNQNIFTGIFEFKNFVSWNGSNQGLSGAIGTFTIPACRFFDCAEDLPESL